MDRCALVVWRTVDENPFMSAAPRARTIVPMPSIEPNTPGPFGLADSGYVRSILESSGWRRDRSSPRSTSNAPMREEDLVRYFTRGSGPWVGCFGDLDADTQARLVELVRPAFDPFIVGDEVRSTAACWMVSATAP